MLGNMLSIGPGLPLANFAMGQMAGMALYRWQAQFIGFTCQQYLPKGRLFQSNCRSTPIPTYVCRRRIDFGAPSKAAVLVRLLLRSLCERRRRFVLMMRALDAWLAGHSYREIAEGLFGKERVRGRSWKDHDLRSLTIRLVKNGIALMRGGYRALLRSPRRKK